MKLKYIDHRPIYIPKLAKYPNGLSLPSGDNTLEVTEGEKINLLKRKNGNNPCFEEVRQRRSIIQEMEE